MSLETLCLGGMIPARRVTDPLGAAPARLEGLARHARRPGADLEQRLEETSGAVPPAFLADWLSTRRRNYALHLCALELAAEGVIEHLCLTLDDTSHYGLTAVERRALEAKTDALSLWPQVDIYPGADEVPVTLLARTLSPAPTPVFVRCSGALGAAGLAYEDRPAGELVKAQLRAADLYGVETPAETAFILAVNTPGVAQCEGVPDLEDVDTPDRHLPKFVDFIGQQLAVGRQVSVADIAYPNEPRRAFFSFCSGCRTSTWRPSAPGTRRATRSGAPPSWASWPLGCMTPLSGPRCASTASSTTRSIRTRCAPS